MIKNEAPLPAAMRPLGFTGKPGMRLLGLLGQFGIEQVRGCTEGTAFEVLRCIPPVRIFAGGKVQIGWFLGTSSRFPR